MTKHRWPCALHGNSSAAPADCECDCSGGLMTCLCALRLPREAVPAAAGGDEDPSTAAAFVFWRVRRMGALNVVPSIWSWWRRQQQQKQQQHLEKQNATTRNGTASLVSHSRARWTQAA
jgi:hypothetical protein